MSVLNKKEVFEEFLDRGTVQVHVMVIHPGVVGVPNDTGVPGLALNYDMRFKNPPIPDLEITDDGISATLSFNQRQHKTFVPWVAVNLIVGMDDSIAVSYAGEVQELPKKRPQLQLV